MVNTAGGGDAGRWEQLVDRAGLGLPPPYQPEPGEAVYEIRVDEHVVQVAETDVVGPLRELVTAVLEEGADVA